MTASEFYLKLRTKDRNLEIRNSIDAESSFAELQKCVSLAAGISASHLKILSGYPREPLVFAATQTLSQCGIKCGDTLYAMEEENRVPSTSAQSSSIAASSASHEPKSHITDNEQRNGVNGILLRKVVPSDNSCLFTSFEFALSGKLDTSANQHMRQLVASIIASQPEEYNDAVLGKPNDEYCKWIQNPSSWGGAIELAVLSNYFGFEIAVVNTVTGHISRFGEDKQYDQRVFLIFDGVHYDPLYMDFPDIGKVQTIFPTGDLDALQQTEQLAIEARSSRQFTDVSQFVIYCTECSSVFVGITELQAHAEKTGHRSFEEVTG